MLALTYRMPSPTCSGPARRWLWPETWNGTHPDSSAGVPTVAESGFPGFEASVWYGFVAPAGLPKPVLAQLHAAVQKAIESPEVREQLAAAGGIPLPGPTEQFDKLLKSDAARYGKLIREASIKPE